MANQVLGYIGKGQIHLRKVGSATGFMPIGEASSFELQIETDEKTLPSNTQSGGGVAASAYSVTSMGVSITGHTFNNEMMAMALYGDASKFAAETVADEMHTAFKGALVPFNKIPNPAEAITVAPSAAGDPFVAGTDYVVTSAGIRILEVGGIADATEIKVGYKTQPQSAIQMLTNSGYEYELFMEGFNDADNGNPFNVRIYRVKFSPTAGLGFIQDDFAENTLSGSALIDTTKTGVGVSKYAQIQRV